MKTYLNIIILCLFSSICFAQLSVRNTAYIFATGIEVYVEDDVKLEESTARFYLRDEAQLIQGTGTTGNSGIGKLSVYQEGTVHNYAYNYWASPVGEVNTNTTTNRNFIVGDILNDVTGLTTNTPAIISASYDGTASPLAISSHFLYSYNPGTLYSEWDYIGSGAPVSPGYGFSMKGSVGSTSQQYDFSGKPNSGNIDVAVLAAQYTLVGNPYPSAINAGAFIHDTDNSSDMLGTLLFWEHDLTVSSHVLTEYVGGYASYTVSADGSMETFIDAMFATLDSYGFPTGTSYDPLTTKVVRQFLPIGQGFMIEGATGTTGTVTFKNSHRTFYKESGAASEFFKTNNSYTQNQPNPVAEYQYNDDGFQILDQGLGLRRFRLNVDFNNEVTRPLVHNFHPDATDGFDYGLECNNSSPNGRDAYFIDETALSYVAQAHQYNIDLKIPLVVTIDADMPLQIRMYDVQNFNNESIYLHDKVTDVYYDLTVVDFNTNLDSGTYTNRFEITFTDNDNALSIDGFADSSFSVYQSNTNSQLVVVNPESIAIKYVSLIDVSGMQIFKKLNLSNATRYEFSTKNLSDGIYVATITLENNISKSKKIIVTNN